MALPVATTVTQLEAGPRARPRLRHRRALLGYALVAPAVLLAIVFFVVPMILLVIMSFSTWPLLGQPSLAGIENYERIISDGAFFRSLWFTAAFTAIVVPASLATSYGAAIMVRGTGRFVAFIRTAFFMPVVIGFTAAAYMASVMLMPGAGIINILLEAMGLTDGQTAWFTDTTRAFWAIIVLTVWKSMGIAMILLMAGMQSVPDELIDAAKIDGAGWWRREISVVFPLIRRQFALCMILALSGTLLVFDQFYVLTQGGPSGSTTSAVMYTYSQSFVRLNLGYGAALSLIITLIILLVAVIQLRVLRADGAEEAR